MKKIRILILTTDTNLSKLSQECLPEKLAFEIFPTMKALGRISELGNYQAILVDDTIKDLKANEVAEYVDIFFKHIPVIILTDDPDLPFRDIPWAASVKTIFSKKKGNGELLKLIRDIVLSANIR